MRAAFTILGSAILGCALSACGSDSTGGPEAAGGSSSGGRPNISTGGSAAGGAPNSGLGGSPINTLGGSSGESSGGSSSGGVSSSGGSSGGASAGSAGLGGTGTGGSAGSGGGSVGGGGGGSTSSCSAVPVTPNATQQTRNVLCYLYSIYGNHILSGQEEGGTDSEVNYIFKTTGKYPAIRAFDSNNAGNDTRCLTHWNAGGLCMIGYHMGVANGMPDGYQSSQTKVSITTVLTEGSDLNTTFKSRMDKAAAQIQKIQDGNGVVIWRPFHEAGGTWFWWSMEGGAQYVKLWKYMFNYMTATKGLKNILWLLPYDGSPDASFYPGKQYVDIGGADNYDKAFDYSPMTNIYNSAKKVFGDTLPIALHECGPVPDPDQLQSAKANWMMFSIWTDPYPGTSWNSTTELQKVYSSSYVISRDEVPSLK